MQEKIEILPVTLLDQQRDVVTELKRLAGELGLEFGWHYLLDLVWIIRHLGAVAGARILDAGAGTGVMQWWLAEHGVEVLSVDRASRCLLPLRFRRWFRVEGLRKSDLAPYGRVIQSNLARPDRWKAQIADWSSLLSTRRSAGKVQLYHQDLQHLKDVPSGTIDAVVGVSALEHNTPTNLAFVVSELMRVLKPGGALLATLGAARDQDWFHQPSQGWCYTDASLRRLFDLPVAASNYDSYDELFEALKQCAELRDNLASFYFNSAENGMPWGKWDPQYQSVGVLKIKSEHG
jgi:ubiquinone/menaquinone biosynthesis C-methylase UbiE